jgi:hypothetical protein
MSQVCMRFIYLNTLNDQLCICVLGVSSLSLFLRLVNYMLSLFRQCVIFPLFLLYLHYYQI